MSLANLIASNAAYAISIIQKFISSPVVGGVSIQTTRFDCIQESEVSRHVLINQQTGNLQNIHDNVAPGPRTWEIEGYVGGFPVELTSQYMPSLRMYVDELDRLFSSREATTLIDPTYRNYTKVMISRFQWSAEPDTRNRVPVKLSLVEITELTVKAGPLAASKGGVVTDVAQYATPPSGGQFGTPSSMGSTQNIELPEPPVASVNFRRFVQ